MGKIIAHAYVHVRPYNALLDRIALVTIFEECKEWLLFHQDGGCIDVHSIDSLQFIKNQTSSASQTDFYVFCERSLVKGFISFFSDNELGHIDLLAVGANFRRQGIAKKLLQFALDAFKKLGIHVVELALKSGNEAAFRLYASFGFECVEICNGYSVLVKKL